MTIDGEETIELTFPPWCLGWLITALALRLLEILTARRGAPLIDTAASVDRGLLKTVRSCLKKAMNTMFNVASKAAAKQAVAYHCRRYLYDEQFREFFKAVEGLNFPKLVDRIGRVHPQINKLFYCNAGIEMMTSEALIMLLSLMDIASGRPPSEFMMPLSARLQMLIS
ncbi:MAG: hypothetical protein U0936_11075 [Planctomycetaceae bacterium]